MEDVAKIAGMAMDGDAGVRGAAADAMGSMDPASTFSLLVELLGDTSREVRIAAVRSIGNQRASHAYEVLLPLFEEDDPELTCEVLAAFAKLGDERAFAPVVVRLFDTNDAIRQNAAAAVGCLGNRAALEPLLMCLEDEVEWVRANGALSLGKLGCVEAVGHLRGLADSRDTETVRANAVVALGDLAGASSDETVYAFLAEVAGDASEDVRVRIAAVLALTSNFRELHLLEETLASQVLGLVCALASEEPDDDLRSTSIWSIGELCRSDLAEELEMDPVAIEGVVSLLERAGGDGHEWCARYSVEALAKVRGER